MAIGNDGSVLHQIRRLFHTGTIAGMSERQLLERFTTARDEAAFEALVARFGPMILGVCRRVLWDEEDVEDAFQATFLVLVRKSRTLGPRVALGCWLYGVACRVALRARAQAARRQVRERQGCVAEGWTEDPSPARLELAEILDQEVCRLPARYRWPIVLCYLDGLTHDEAALRLGWPVGTVKGRLARARDQLRLRLTRRGLTLSSAVLSATLASDARAAIPAALSAVTTRAALRTAGSQTLVSVVSTSVTFLTKGVLTSMSLHPWKTAGLALFAFGAGAGVVAYQANSAGDRDRPILLAAADRERSQAALDKPDAKYESVIRHLDDRITHKFTGETPLEDILKYIKQVTQGPGDHGVPIYVDPAGLVEVGRTAEWPVRLSINDASLKTTLSAALRPLGLDYRVKSDGVLMISSRRAILQQENDALREEVGRLKAELNVARGRAERPAAPSPFEAGRRQGTATGTDDLRSQAILTKLDDPISMSFAKETRLEDILKYIKAATQGPHDNGIPIYVDPVGMNEAEKTTASTVTLDLEGVPLKTTLKLLLEQIGLRYKVKDGVLIITSKDLEDPDRDIETPLQKLVRNAEQGHLEPGLIRGLIGLLKVSEELRRAKQEIDEATRGLEPVGSFR